MIQNTKDIASNQQESSKKPSHQSKGLSLTPYLVLHSEDFTFEPIRFFYKWHLQITNKGNFPSSTCNVYLAISRKKLKTSIPLNEFDIKKSAVISVQAGETKKIPMFWWKFWYRLFYKSVVCFIFDPIFDPIDVHTPITKNLVDRKILVSAWIRRRR